MKEILGKEFVKFQEILSELEYIKYTLNGLMVWDNLINLPEGAFEYRKKVMNYFIKEYYKKISMLEFKKGYQKLEKKEKKTQEELAILRNLRKELGYISKIPVSEYTKYITSLTEVEEEWKIAKNKKDYETVKKQLVNIFEILRGFTRYWNTSEDPYEVLIKNYEKGLSVEKLEEIIEEIKKELLPLLKKIPKKNKEKLILKDENNDKQLELSKEILIELGFEMKYGRVDIGEYPTTLSNTSNDVRIITTFTKDLLAGVYNTLHETGKGLYEQGIDKNLLGNFLSEIPSQILNEAIAKIYENRIGRSREYTDILLEKIKKYFFQFKDVQEEEFYKLVNQIDKNPIRIEADELSYNFHIILRCELERELLEKKIKFDELFEKSQKRYKEYLEIELEDESQGVLQDAHWVSGYIGFFPLYIIADIVAAQLINQFEKENGKLEEIIKNREFFKLKNWLNEKIFKYGSLYNFEEILLRVTGEEINPKYYIEYIKNKYQVLYKIN